MATEVFHNPKIIPNAQLTAKAFQVGGMHDIIAQPKHGELACFNGSEFFTVLKTWAKSY